jgi:hypothetical protein
MSSGQAIHRLRAGKLNPLSHPIMTIYFDKGSLDPAAVDPELGATQHNQFSNATHHTRTVKHVLFSDQSESAYVCYRTEHYTHVVHRKDVYEQRNKMLRSNYRLHRDVENALPKSRDSSFSDEPRL